VIAQSRLSVTDHAVDYGLIVLRYDDLRAAGAAFLKLRTDYPTWTTDYVPGEDFLLYQPIHNGSHNSEFEGCVLVTLSPKAGQGQVGLGLAHDPLYLSELRHTLACAGDIKAFEPIVFSQFFFACRVEYYSMTAAEHAVANSASQGVHVRVNRAQHRTPFLTLQGYHLKVVRYSISDHDQKTGNHPRRYTTEPMTLPKVQPALLQTLSALGPAHFGSLASITGQFDRRLQHRGRDHASANHNVVDVERIQRGLDVRTTVCRLHLSLRYAHKR